MIDPDSPIVTAALNGWFAESGKHIDALLTDGDIETIPRLAMAAALEAALAEWQRQSGPFSALTIAFGCAK